MPAKPTQSSGPVELLVLALIVALLAVSASVYAAGKLCSLWTRRPLRVSFVETPAIVMGWVMARFSDQPLLRPRADVWPASDGVVQVVALVVALVVVALVVVAWSLLTHGRGAGGSRRRDPDAARWASVWALRSLLVRPWQNVAGRLVLGTGRFRMRLAVERLASIFILGPSQSRKTTGLAIPNLLEWNGCAVVTSIKPDLLLETIEERRRRGRVWVFNPAGVPGIPSDGWNPLAACTSWPASREMARWLAEAAAGTKRHAPGEAEFWDFAGAKLLAPVLWAAAIGDEVVGPDGIGQVVAWLDELGEPASDEPNSTNLAREEIRKRLATAGALEAIRAFDAIMWQDERQRSGTLSTAQKILDVFADDATAAACSRDDIDAERLLDGGTLYLFAPLHEQNRLRPVFEALLMVVIRAAMERSAATGRPLDPTLLVLLDEAGNIAPLAQLAQIASSGAGQGIQLVSIFQDLAQVRHRYGDQAWTVVNNHRAKVILSGLSDPDSLNYVSALIGDAAEQEESETRGDGRTSTTRRVAYRRLAPMAALRQIRPGFGVVVYGHLKPVRLRLRSVRADRRLKRLTRIVPAVPTNLEEARRERRPRLRRRAGGDRAVVDLADARRGRRRA